MVMGSFAMVKKGLGVLIYYEENSAVPNALRGKNGCEALSNGKNLPQTGSM